MCHVITVHVRTCFLVPGKDWAPCHPAMLMSGCLMLQLPEGDSSGNQGARCACMPLDWQKGCTLKRCGNM